MRNKNLSAWNIAPSSFDGIPAEKRLEFLVRFAVLAPSSHNSQPWKFRIEPSAIIVEPEPARSLPASDADDRQLYISLGCAIENIALAADLYGYHAEIERIDPGRRAAWKIRIDGEASSAASRQKDHLAYAIPRRKTVRTPYEPRLPALSFLDRLRSLSVPSLRIFIIEDERSRAEVASLVSKALVEAMDNEEFRIELSRYIHPNITRAKVGMPMDGFGMPTLLSFIAPALVRKVNVNRASQKRDEELLSKHTPAFGVIATDNDDPEAWMRAGRTYERIALEAVRQGICTAPMAAAIEIGEHYKRLQGLLKTELRPQVFFRMGYSSADPRHSPRLEASEVIDRGAS